MTLSTYTEAEEKLKLISNDQELNSFNYLTPQRINKQKWVVDAWDNCNQNPQQSPERRIYQQKIVQNYSYKNIRVRKIQKDEKEEQLQTRQKHHSLIKLNKVCLDDSLEKQNNEKNKTAQRVTRTPLRKKKLLPMFDDVSQEVEFKTPISSIIYPVIKYTNKPKRQRIDRFHSFVARTIRK